MSEAIVSTVEGAPKKPGLRAAINRMCRDCLYYPGAGGTWRFQVENCTSSGCPLYPLRPVSSAYRARTTIHAALSRTRG
jgi:Zn-finger protein